MSKSCSEVSSLTFKSVELKISVFIEDIAVSECASVIFKFNVKFCRLKKIVKYTQDVLFHAVNIFRIAVHGICKWLMFSKYREFAFL